MPGLFFNNLPGSSRCNNRSTNTAAVHSTTTLPNAQFNTRGSLSMFMNISTKNSSGGNTVSGGCGCGK